MKLRLLSIVAASMLFVLNACSPQQSEILVAEFQDIPVTLNEFESAYAKNAGGVDEAKDDSLSQYKNFLDLYVNYKMKLRDAEVRNYEKDPAMIAELNDYKKKVGVSFIKEKVITEPSLRSFYEKKKEEMRVSHIMIRADKRTLEDAKQIALNLLDSLKKGADFAELASKYSEDQFSKDNNGDIYYITAGQIIPAFEDAVYATKKGEVYPEPVETRYGYHIVKVTDRGPRIDKVHARHILIDFKDENGTIDSLKAKFTAQNILDSLRAGADFADMAIRHSEDRGSAPNGGDLGFFERRRMVKEFDEAAFKLDVNEISDLVKTRYGYHIIQVVEKSEIPPYEEEKSKLRNIYDKVYFNDELNAYVDSLKKEFNFKVNEEGITKFENGLDSVTVNMYPNIEERDKVKDFVLFTYAGNSITADSAFIFVLPDSKYKNKIIDRKVIDDVIEDNAKQLLLEEKAMSLDKTNKEFADLMADYKNGIYIFKLQEDEVWNKISIDSTELKKFYDKTKENYVTPDKAEYSAIQTKSDSTINVYYSELTPDTNFDEYAHEKTERPGMREKKGYYGTKNVKDDELAAKAFALEEGKYSKPFKYNNAWYIVYLHKKTPSRMKTYEEAKPEAASAYQEVQSKELEKEYIESLNKRYTPEIYYDNLKKAFVEEPVENN